MTPPHHCPLPHPASPPSAPATGPTIPATRGTWPTAPRSATLVTERSARAVPQARAHLRDVLHAWHLPPPLVDDAALVVTELAANAVHHGTGPALRLHTRFHQHVLRCQLHDDGPADRGHHPAPRNDEIRSSHVPPDRHEIRDPHKIRDPHAIRNLPETGRGLALVHALATRWGTYTDPHLTTGTHVAWVELTCPETDTDLLRRVLDGLRRR